MKRIRSIIICTVLTVALMLPLSSCGGGVNTDIAYGHFGGTYFQLYDYSGMSEREFDSLFDKLCDRLEYYSRLYDIYYEYSGINNLRTVNLNAGSAVSVPQEIIDLIEYSKEMYELTDGEVNIAFGAVLSLWHDARYSEVKYIPTEAELSAAAGHCDINDILIDREAMTVRLADSQMSLDVGAVAKGYAVERLAEYAAELGATSLVIDVGGNLRTVGEHPDGEGWTMHVRNPDLSDENKKALTVDGVLGAFVTSGNYQQYFEYMGKKYHHIIDKDTLMPAEYFASVSVVCESSALADALSTALFSMPQDAGAALVSELASVGRVVWIFDGGEIAEYIKDSTK